MFNNWSSLNKYLFTNKSANLITRRYFISLYRVVRGVLSAKERQEGLRVGRDYVTHSKIKGLSKKYKIKRKIIKKKILT